jgi:hypothetical protein
MRKIKQGLLYAICLLLVSITGVSQKKSSDFELLKNNFESPPAAAKPWVFWYWMHDAVSKEGITADLEAMKEAGIGGAYLMTIKDTSSAIPFQPVVRQLTPGWWEMVNFAMKEAKRLGLQLAMHVSDGFALAGGPWITPELSMQKLVWTKTYVTGGNNDIITLEQPKANEDYYKDIAVFAYPANSTYAFGDEVLIPHVLASNGSKPQFLCFNNSENEQSFKSDTACWIQYKYPKPFTCRSIRIHSGGNNYQAQRLVLQVSDDGENFTTFTQLQPPRHGWQDGDEDYTHAIPAVTAKYFRFVYDKEGSEPGAEDLDAAKWKPTLKLMGIYLSDEPVINQYEAKNGSVWRIAANTTEEQVLEKDAIPLKSIIDITDKMDENGRLNWTVPQGDWVIIRIGHTSTGQTNATGGAAKGLECDKFNASAVILQFNNWFAKAFEKTDPGLAKEVLKIFHVDSWECGSQNWSDNFREEFKKRRGYDLYPYLPVIAGVPIGNASISEKVLHDVRETIAELINDVFYATLNKLAHEKGCSFAAESVAPTMVSDGMLHYKNVDIPMGEFWYNSPTHDKPNDMHDAISGAHIYGKNIVQAEAFTTVRMDWSEYPGTLKTLGDRNFALGANKMVIHVFTHNPWLDKKPGMTLDGVGLYFQRDQTWFKQSKAWIDYLSRSQAILQSGKPVVDIAVFTGEEVPRRSVLPDRLVNTLPGIFGDQKVAEEKARLENKGQSLRQIPDGVTNSANMADPEKWIDPLNGYSYDSFNPDALMLMTFKNGRVVLPGGADYGVLVFPDHNSMNPNDGLISLPVANKILELLKAGAKIIMSKNYVAGVGLKDDDLAVKSVMNEIISFSNKGRLFFTPFTKDDFSKLGVEKDLDIENNNHVIAWTHRRMGSMDIYFLSNQSDSAQSYRIRFRDHSKYAQLIYPDSQSIGELTVGKSGSFVGAIPAAASVFYVFTNESYTESKQESGDMNELDLSGNKWEIQFDKNYGGPETPVETNELKSWTRFSDSSVMYYSGTALYTTTFDFKDEKPGVASVQIDSVYGMATVKVNGIDCGTIWYGSGGGADISKALKRGANVLQIEVSNTWHNRLIRDEMLPVGKRITWTTAPFRLKNKPLLPAGLAGTVKIVSQ